MHLVPLSSCCNHGIFSSQCSWKQRSRLSSYFLLSALVATFSCFHFTPGLVFGEKDIGHPAITEYLSLTGQGKLQNRKIISERKQTFYGNSLPVRRTDKESIFVGLNIFNPTKLTLFRNSVLTSLYASIHRTQICDCFGKYICQKCSKLSL